MENPKYEYLLWKNNNYQRWILVKEYKIKIKQETKNKLLIVCKSSSLKINLILDSKTKIILIQ